MSCNKEPIYTKEDLLKLAQSHDSTVTIILPKSLEDGVNCQDYPSGCVSAHRVQVRGEDFIAVEFMNQQDAMIAAKKLGGFYLRNWVLDDVVGEPGLEKFATEKLKAQKL